jgi:hypothetical protein
MAGLVFAGVLTLNSPAAANAQQHDQHDHPAGQATQAPTHHMMEMHHRMMADHKAGDAALQPLIEKMTAAKGEAKIEAMASVIVELVRQRTMMHNHMEHMMHMVGGLPADSGKPTQGCAGCPSVKGETPRSPKP